MAGWHGACINWGATVGMPESSRTVRAAVRLAAEVK